MDGAGFRLVFRCKASGSSSRAGMTASINLTSSQGEEFCPILFYFFKICSSNGEGDSSNWLDKEN